MVSRKEEVAANLLKISATVDEDLGYVRYLFLEQVESALMNSALSMKAMNWESH